MINRWALEAAGVYANDDVERINAESTVRIEMPLAIRRASVGFYGSATIGAFGTFDSVVGPDVASIGRYVSVACGAQFGVFEHPIDRLTNSAVTFHAGYFGQGPEPAPIATKPPIVIEHDVLVGDGALIKRGVTLHTGCIVGARAVVTRDVPPYAIVCGSPARILKYRLPKKTIRRLLASQWWAYDLRQVPFPLGDIDRVLAYLDAGKLEPYTGQILNGWEISRIAETPDERRRLVRNA